MYKQENITEIWDRYQKRRIVENGTHIVDKVGDEINIGVSMQDEKQVIQVVSNARGLEKSHTDRTWE